MTNSIGSVYQTQGTACSHYTTTSLLWCNSVTMAMVAPLEDPKDQMRGDYHGENLAIWSLRIKTDLMEYYQSISQFHIFVSELLYNKAHYPQYPYSN